MSDHKHTPGERKTSFGPDDRLRAAIREARQHLSEAERHMDVEDELHGRALYDVAISIARADEALALADGQEEA